MIFFNVFIARHKKDHPTFPLQTQSLQINNMTNNSNAHYCRPLRMANMHIYGKCVMLLFNLIYKETGEPSNCPGGVIVNMPSKRQNLYNVNILM